VLKNPGIWRGCPWSQLENPGAAMRLLRSMASWNLSFLGKKVSTSNTPNSLTGGSCMDRINVLKSTSSPRLQKYSKRVESSMCSRERTGSASAPMSPSSALTVPPICSLNNSVLVSQASCGAENDWRMETGTPASLPGVNIV